MSNGDPNKLGTALFVSSDEAANRLISSIMMEHRIAVENSVDLFGALDQLSRRKFEAVVIDFSLGEQATTSLQKLRSSSNRTAVSFALTNGGPETTRAVNQGFRFVLERPLTPELIQHTLRVAYGLIVRERRRYFRYLISVPVVFSPKGDASVYGQSINISEGGLALSCVPPPPLGGEGTAQFTLPPSLRISAHCRVCWNKDRGEAGLAFMLLPFEVASDLQIWLAQKLEGQLPTRT